MQWVLTGYTLALATVIPLSGWAADRFGTKRIYLTAIFLFMVGSALAGMAWSAESLILFRVLQGLGGGMLMPLGMTILTKAAGPDRVGRVMAVIGVPMLLGPIVGPILGGWLVDDVSLALDLLHQRADRHRHADPRRADPRQGRAAADREARRARPAPALAGARRADLRPGPGALARGRSATPRCTCPAIAGALLVAAFIRHAARTPHALIDLKLFRDRGFSIVDWSRWCCS